MNDAKHIEQREKPQWDAFLQKNAGSIAKIKETNHRLDNRNYFQQCEFSKNNEDLNNFIVKNYLDYVLTGVMSTLTNRADKEPILSKDIETIRKLTGSIIEAKNEGILNEDETLALLKFLTSKFVESRVNRIVKHMLPNKEHKQWFYKSHKISCQNA